MWKRKLSSRKLWMSILALVSAIAVVFGANDMQRNQMTAVVSAFAVLVMYVVSETISDVKNKKVGDPDAPINWKSKFTSRKFWAALVSFIAALLVAFGCDDITIEQVNGLIGAIATVCVYILGEGIVDASNGSSPSESLYDLMLQDAFDKVSASESDLFKENNDETVITEEKVEN